MQTRKAGAAAQCAGGTAPPVSSRNPVSVRLRTLRTELLVSRNLRVDFQTPTVDPAADTYGVFSSARTQPRGHLQASNAVVAKHQDVSVVGETLDLLQFRRNRIHRDKQASLNVGKGEFLRFSDI